tara:strand:+ start:10623 stop:11228 length:606 start_codon:yes stop_codon:yes gene_type:complete
MNNEFVRLTTLNPSYRLILLHGWGANAQDLIPLGKNLQESCSRRLEIVSLNAPHQQDQGLGREWYRLFPPDWMQLPSAVSSLEDRVKAIATEKIPLNKTVILGFSQGGAMALASGCKLPLAGLICCSAYPHPGWNVPLKMPPLFLSHGQYDEVVPYEAAQKLEQMISNQGLEIEVQTFYGGHEIPLDLYKNFTNFLNKCFA